MTNFSIEPERDYNTVSGVTKESMINDLQKLLKEFPQGTNRPAAYIVLAQDLYDTLAVQSLPLEIEAPDYRTRMGSVFAGYSYSPIYNPYQIPIYRGIFNSYDGGYVPPPRKIVYKEIPKPAKLTTAQLAVIISGLTLLLLQAFSVIN